MEINGVITLTLSMNEATVLKKYLNLKNSSVEVSKYISESHDFGATDIRYLNSMREKLNEFLLRPTSNWELNEE